MLVVVILPLSRLLNKEVQSHGGQDVLNYSWKSFMSEACRLHEMTYQPHFLSEILRWRFDGPPEYKYLRWGIPRTYEADTSSVYSSKIQNDAGVPTCAPKCPEGSLAWRTKSRGPEKASRCHVRRRRVGNIGSWSRFFSWKCPWWFFLSTTDFSFVTEFNGK